MNILYLLTKLSVDELHELQMAVLGEIQRRRELARNPADILVIGGRKRGKGGQSVPEPDAASPLPKRRAA